MKFALAQLRKFSMPYSYDESLDLSDELNGHEDIISSGLCNVHTVIRERGDETYLCEFSIKIELVLEDSVSLEEIPFNMDFNASELFTKDPDNCDAYYIEKETLDTKDAIITAILAEKPMTTTNHEFIDDINEDEEDEDDGINPAFRNLKDLL